MRGESQQYTVKHAPDMFCTGTRNESNICCQYSCLIHLSSDLLQLTCMAVDGDFYHCCCCCCCYTTATSAMTQPGV